MPSHPGFACWVRNDAVEGARNKFAKLAFMSLSALRGLGFCGLRHEALPGDEANLIPPCTACDARMHYRKDRERRSRTRSARHSAAKGAESTAVMHIDSAVTFILVLAGLASTPAISQDAAGLRAPGSRPLITSVSVAEASDRIYVEVAFTELIQPEVSRLEHPDRLVFDFPGCDLASPVSALWSIVDQSWRCVLPRWGSNPRSQEWL